MVIPRRDRTPARSWWGSTLPTTFVTLSATTWICTLFEVTTACKFVGARFYMPGDGAAFAWRWAFGDEANSLEYRSGSFFFPPDKSTARWVNAWSRQRYTMVPGVNYAIGVLVQSAYLRTGSLLTTAGLTHDIVKFNKGYQSTSQNAPFNIAPTFNNNGNGVDILYGHIGESV